VLSTRGREAYSGWGQEKNCKKNPGKGEESQQKRGYRSRKDLPEKPKKKCLWVLEDTGGAGQPKDNVHAMVLREVALRKNDLFLSFMESIRPRKDQPREDDLKPEGVKRVRAQCGGVGGGGKNESGGPLRAYP